jgi:hypothetical protein
VMLKPLNLMHECPHCKAPAVPGIQVRWSSRETPATCTNCGKLSHVLASTNSGIFSVCLVLLSCTVALGVILESWVASAVGVAIVVCYNVWAWRQVELFPISPESAKVAARVSWVVLMVAAIARIFSS